MKKTNRNQWGVLSLVVLTAVAGLTANAYYYFTCKVKAKLPCVEAGDTCHIEYNGVMHEGTIKENGTNIWQCAKGSPGRYICTPQRYIDCYYICVINVDGKNIEIETKKTVGTDPVLSGGSC